MAIFGIYVGFLGGKLNRNNLGQKWIKTMSISLELLSRLTDLPLLNISQNSTRKPNIETQTSRFGSDDFP